MDGFAAMGGYAGYLAVAYAVTAIVVVGNMVAARRQFDRTRRRLREQLERRSARRPATGSQTQVAGHVDGQVDHKAGRDSTLGRSS